MVLQRGRGGGVVGVGLIVGGLLVVRIKYLCSPFLSVHTSPRLNDASK